MRDTKNQHVAGFKTVHDYVLAHCHTTVPDTEIFIAGTSYIGEAGKYEETIGYGVDQPVGNLDAAAFLSGAFLPN